MVSTGAMLGTLVPDGVRRAIGWRRVLTGTAIGEGADLLVVRVGPEVPCRLLILHSGDDGMARLALYELGKTSKLVASESCFPDLTEYVLQKWATKYKLGG